MNVKIKKKKELTVPYKVLEYVETCFGHNYLALPCKNNQINNYVSKSCIPDDCDEPTRVVLAVKQLSVKKGGSGHAQVVRRVSFLYMHWPPDSVQSVQHPAPIFHQTSNPCWRT